MSPQQWAEWVEFYGLEPWGFDISDSALGTLASTVAASAGAKDVKPEDFMLGPRLPGRESLNEEMRIKMMMARVRAAWGGGTVEPGQS